VPEVHAIEVADGEGTRDALIDGRKAAEDLHAHGRKTLNHKAIQAVPGGGGVLDCGPFPIRAPLKTLAILISGQGSNMASLARACLEERWPARVAAVISNREGAAGLATARELGLPAEALPHAGFDGREAFDAALAARLDALGADLVVLAGFMRILTDGFVRRFEGRLVNIHPSLLPAFPGLDTHARALGAGVRVHGATVHLVTPTLDHGPILAQAAVPVLDGDDPRSLAARVLRAEHRIYPAAVRWLVEGRVRVRDGRAEVDGVGAAARLLWEPAA
jgi:phosphoribosylglycinamide formyltransferase-1